MDSCHPGSLKFVAFHAVATPSVDSGLSILHAACINGDLETFSIILTCSPSHLDTWIALSIKTDNHARENGRKLPEDILKFTSPDSLRTQQMLHLMKKAAGNSQPKSMLHAAARNGHVHHVDKLLKLSKNINAFSKNPEDKAATALILASAHNTSDMVTYLLEKGSGLLAFDTQFQMAIHHAASSGNIQSINALIEYGSDVNAKGYRGKTPLHFAALNGNTEAINVLCENGADVKARTGFGDTPLLCSAQCGHIESMELLLRKGASIHDRNSIGFSALFYAVKKGDVALARLLIGLGSDVNTRTRMRDTPLITASGREGNKEMVEFLLQSRADINLTDRQGRGPLHHAADAEIAAVLLDAGANIEASDLYGRLTPLLFVCKLENSHSNLSVASRLIERGANVNRQEMISLYSPLHHLCSRDDHESANEVVQLLLDRGGDVNALDSEGETPLFAAVRNANIHLVRLLIGHGASVNVKNASSLSPLHVGTEAERGHGEAMTFVLKELQKCHAIKK